MMMLICVVCYFIFLVPSCQHKHTVKLSMIFVDVMILDSNVEAAVKQQFYPTLDYTTSYLWHFSSLLPLPPLPHPDQKESQLHPRHRGKVGLTKSAWCAQMRLQAVTMVFSLVAAARSSSREQWKVWSWNTGVIIVIFGWRHDHYKVMYCNTAN